MKNATNIKLKPHQQRVVDEKNQLEDKIDKLSGFLHSDLSKNLDEHEQLRMVTQLNIMTAYSGILLQRIMNF